MRTYGRIVPNPLYPTVKKWVEVTTDPNGFNDAVWLLTLIQCLKLNLNESPFFGNYGIPAQQSVVTQVIPDFYVMMMQNLFAQYFASLIISRTSSNPPTYTVAVVTNSGAKISRTVVT